MKRILYGIVVSALSLAVDPAFSQDELVGDRPDVTESAVTITPGHVQLEAGATRVRTDAAIELALGELLGRMGLVRGIELRLGVPSYVIILDEGPHGFEDASVGAKFLVNDYHSERPNWPQTAVVVETTMPTGSDGLSESRMQPAALLAVEWPLGEKTGIGVNLGGALVRHVEFEDRLQGLASIVLGRDLGDHLGGFVELYGFTSEGPGDDAHVFFDGGITYALSAELQLDARVGIELGNGFEQRLAGMGVIWRY